MHSGDPCAGGPVCHQTCNEAQDNCFDPAGTPCPDGNACNGQETCESGTCTAGPPLDCTDYTNIVDALTFTWLATNCDGVDTFELTINGTTVATPPPDPTGFGCTCFPGISTFTVPVNDALALLVAESNQFGVRKSSSFTGLAWAFATLTVNGAAQQTLIYGSPGNFDRPDPDLCNGNTFGPVDAAGTTAALDLLPNTCTTDSCDTITGCVHTPVADGNSCDDGVFCNGGDTCNQGHCAVHSGDPCPGTPCNTCQEAAQSCFDPPGGSGVGVRVGYLRGASAPWEVDTNERAMDRVFGAGQWSDLRLADGAGPFAVGTGNDYGFLFVEGGDSTATEFSAFLAAHGTAIATWVNAGGSLILNAAPNVGGSFSMGFGVTLNYPDPAGAVIGADSGHPVFNGPYGATGTAFTGGSFSHATVAGGSLMPIILRSPENDIVLGEQVAGNGHVLFGGMTPDFFHQPQPNAANLTANILAYAASLHHDSACIVDDNRCIIAQCDGDGSCVPVGAVSCPDDGNVCNGPESCNPATGGCVSGPPLAGGSDCEDHTFCNGTDTCDAAGHCSVHSGDPCPGTPCNTCQEAAPGCFDPPGTPCQADDSLCTVDQCTGGGEYVQVSTLSCPDDGNVCNGPESCDPAAGCVSGPPPVPACAACGDGVIDVDEDCDVGGTCIGGAAAGTPCFVNGTPCPGGTCTPFGGTGKLRRELYLRARRAVSAGPRAAGWLGHPPRHEWGGDCQ